MNSQTAKLTAAAVLLIAVGVLLDHLSGSGSDSVAWADVAGRFQSVPFFNATIYIKENGATTEPVQMELWRSCDGRARIRFGTQVVFGRNGDVIEAFDIITRTKIEANDWAAEMLDKLGRAETFSLDTMVQLMFGGTMEDVTPLVNPDAVVSQDMVVFDIDIPGLSEWARIWALRESRLPVRIRAWDPRDGDATDMVFEYSREQRDEFFDPNAFSVLLQSSDVLGRQNIAYAFMEDPGGKDITPQDIFEESGYHVPEVEQAGITPDGAVWIIAARGRNRMPNGHSFSGFQKLRDDLGREYRSVYGSHETLSDQSMQVFIPFDYPFDGRIPGRLVLVCEKADYHPRATQEIIGTVELVRWKQGQLWPEGTIRVNEWSFRFQMARTHCKNRDYDKTERILSRIQGPPENNPAALTRDRVRLRMLLQQARYDEAVTLTERLMPLLGADYHKWNGYAPDPTRFTDCILTFACAGRFDEAKRIWEQIKGSQPELDPRLTQAARQSIKEEIQRRFDRCLRVLVPDLSGMAHLTNEQISELLGSDISEHDEYRRAAE